jgi:hypothetical protein
MQAVAFTQLALDQVRNERSRRHLLAIKESRINGLIDIVQRETRILEALLTLKGICEAGSVGAAVHGAVPGNPRWTGDPVDCQSSKGNELARPRSGDGEVADDPRSAASTAAPIHTTMPAHFPSADRGTSAAVGMP